MSFIFHLPTRLYFGRPASVALNQALSMHRAQRVLLVSDSGLVRLGMVEEIRAGLAINNRSVQVFANVSSNPTTQEVAEGLDAAMGFRAQAIVALGGGSVIDVGKAIAMLMTNGGEYADYLWHGKRIVKRSLPMAAVPTTAGTGSEVSRVAVIVDPENPFKKGVLSPLMFPHDAVIDPELTLGMPLWLTASTGMDAFTHALEAYLGHRSHPFTDKLALAALETIWWALPASAADGRNIHAREAMMMAALWAGIAMDHAGLGLVHALSGPITSRFHLHHGMTNAMLLPHVLRFNMMAISLERRRHLNRIMGLSENAPGEALVRHIDDFIHDLGLSTDPKHMVPDMDDGVLDAIVKDAMKMAMMRNNPRPVDEESCRALLLDMMRGD
ncbi:MAG: iron-containing alcohol dehydrogenase [Chloroflexi bacterium]|nr:iron-containing alcohol dehydrogenase [Chloroflexota bacterium]